MRIWASSSTNRTWERRWRRRCKRLPMERRLSRKLIESVWRRCGRYSSGLRACLTSLGASSSNDSLKIAVLLILKRDRALSTVISIKPSSCCVQSATRINCGFSKPGQAVSSSFHAQVFQSINIPLICLKASLIALNSMIKPVLNASSVTQRKSSSLI